MEHPKRRLVVALVGALALVGVLVAVQLVDDGDGANRNRADVPVRVKGAEVERATLSGTVSQTDGWTVEVTVLGTDGTTKQAAADRRGRYRFDDLPTGPVEVSWVAQNSGSAGGGISLGGQRTGRAQITLDIGRNTYDITL